ncbi:MAG TPA: site-2 protease family protein [Chitinophagaceae bacterium]|jgi:stage IV sporulation protein FB|nr:site-2 protease family protein [Chitinophagaceae bacterium]
MENNPPHFSPDPGSENRDANDTSSTPLFEYPPKPELENKKGNVWVRSITSLALYLLIGYYFFNYFFGADWIWLLIITGIVIFHELGHFLAMKAFHYKELGIFFIPLLGAYASGTKREVSQRQSAIILLAGPLPGIIVGIALLILAKSRITEMGYEEYWLLTKTAALLIFLNVLNLLPIYPLDGGQLLNRLFLDESKIIGKIFVVVSALALGYFAVKIEFYALLVLPAMLLFRLRSDTRFDEMTRKVEASGINLEKTYEEITDEEYWNIRNILIANNYSTLRNVNPAPPYEYSANEDRVVNAIENLLQRTIIQDVSWLGKAIVILIWAGSFAAPFLLKLDIPFLSYHAR